MTRKNKRDLKSAQKSKKEIKEVSERHGVPYKDRTPLKMKKKILESIIVHAFRETKYRWRTANGIAKQTKLDYEDVFNFLEKSNLIIRARKSNKQGQPLFALRERYNRASPFTVRLLNAITNKIH